MEKGEKGAGVKRKKAGDGVEDGLRQNSLFKTIVHQSLEERQREIIFDGQLMHCIRRSKLLVILQ